MDRRRRGDGLRKAALQLLRMLCFESPPAAGLRPPRRRPHFVLHAGGCASSSPPESAPRTPRRRPRPVLPLAVVPGPPHGRLRACDPSSPRAAAPCSPHRRPLLPSPPPSPASRAAAGPRILHHRRPPASRAAASPCIPPQSNRAEQSSPIEQSGPLPPAEQSRSVSTASVRMRMVSSRSVPMELLVTAWATVTVQATVYAATSQVTLAVQAAE
jgi:hypothetical protein